MTNFKITIDSGDIGRLARKLEGLKKGLSGQVIARGLERTAQQAKTAASTQIREVYNIKKGALDRRFQVIVNKKAGMAMLRARSLKTSRIPLIRFDAKRLVKGVSFEMTRGKRVTLKHAFIAKMNSGHTGIYQREMGSRKIKEVVGIDVPQMFGGAKVMPVVAKRIEQQLEKNIVHELTFAIQRALG